MATDTRKQNWRFQQADHRWRNKVVWVTKDPDERALIKAEIRWDKLTMEIDVWWSHLYQRGYGEMTQAQRVEAFDSEISEILGLMKQRDRLEKRMARLEEKTGKTRLEVGGNHRMANVKSVCF